MGIIGLVSKFSPKIGDLTLDAELSETHERSAEVSEWPIEQGSDISDHRAILPEVVNIEGVVSSAPTSFAQIAGPLAPLSIPEGFRALEALFQLKTVITVVTRLKVYENMVITRLSIPQNQDVGEAVYFTMELRNIRTVSTQRVAVEPEAPEKSAPKTNQGKKPPKQSAPDLSQDPDSVLNQIEDFFGIPK